jgi:hypothetical protein
LAAIRGVELVQGNPEWRCRSWCKDVLEAVAADGRAMRTAVLDWARVEEVARWYVGIKTEEGRFANAGLFAKPKPTWNILEGKEMIP